MEKGHALVSPSLRSPDYNSSCSPSCSAIVPSVCAGRLFVKLHKVYSGPQEQQIGDFLKSVDRSHAAWVAFFQEDQSSSAYSITRDQRR
jgi:hypothetical protein